MASLGFCGGAVSGYISLMPWFGGGGPDLLGSLHWVKSPTAAVPRLSRPGRQKGERNKSTLNVVGKILPKGHAMSPMRNPSVELLLPLPAWRLCPQGSRAVTPVGGASPRTPAGDHHHDPGGLPLACDTKTKDLPSPELGLALPQPLACCPWRGTASPAQRKQNRKTHCQCRTPKQEAGCALVHLQPQSLSKCCFRSRPGERVPGGGGGPSRAARALALPAGG